MNLPQLAKSFFFFKGVPEPAGPQQSLSQRKQNACSTAPKPKLLAPNSMLCSCLGATQILYLYIIDMHARMSLKLSWELTKQCGLTCPVASQHLIDQSKYGVENP